MQTAQTNKKEMERKPCIGNGLGRPGVAGVAMKTCCSIAALLMLTVGMTFNCLAAIPLVYDVENTGTNFPAPPLPILANLPTILPLPDPFAWANDPRNMSGTRSTNFTDW